MYLSKQYVANRLAIRTYVIMMKAAANPGAKFVKFARGMVIMEKTLSYNKTQLKERPTIRKIAEQFLNEKLRAQLEMFLQYTEQNKMPLSLCRCNTFQSNYKGNTVFRIEIANGQACQPDTYAIRVYTADNPCHYREENKESIQNSLNTYLLKLDVSMRDYFFEHLPRCRGCGKCKPGVALEVLGKRKSGICACYI